MPVPLAVAAVAAIEAHGTAAVSAAAGSVGALTALLLSRSKARVKPDIDGAALLAALGDGVDARIRALSSDPAVTTASQINEVVAILKAHFADDGRVKWISGVKDTATAEPAASSAAGDAGGASKDGAGATTDGGTDAGADEETDAGAKAKAKAKAAKAKKRAAKLDAPQEEGADSAHESLLVAFSRKLLEDALEWGHVFVINDSGSVQAVMLMLPLRVGEAPAPVAVPKGDALHPSAARRLVEYNRAVARQLASCDVGGGGGGATDQGKAKGSGRRADGVMFVPAIATAAAAPRAAGAGADAGLGQGEGEGDGEGKGESSGMGVHASYTRSLVRAARMIGDHLGRTVCAHLVRGALTEAMQPQQFRMKESIMLGAFGADPTYNQLVAMQRMPYKVLVARPRSLQYKVMYARPPPPPKILSGNGSRFRSAGGAKSMSEEE